MAITISPPRGMRDFLPSEKARRERALGVIRRVYGAHGFDEIETPAMEDIERLHSGLGGENEKLGFSVLKRGLSPAELGTAAASGGVGGLCDLGMRFDLTVPLSRFYASHRGDLPPVFRSLQIAPVWRAERPQKGRYRQFVQCDIDIIGESSQLAETELITATAHVLNALGLDECTIRLNDRRILEGLLRYCGFATERFPSALISLDKLDKIGVQGVVAELSENGPDAAAVLGGILASFESNSADGGVGLTVDEITRLLPDGIDPDAVASLESLAHTLPRLPGGVGLRFDPTLVRGMGYYTGAIFEIAHPASGSSIGGGGRYDGMIGRLVGSDVPAAGFSIGFERIIELVDLDVDDRPEAVVLVHDAFADHPDDGLTVAQLLAIKSALVVTGKRVRIERNRKNLTGLLNRAAVDGFSRYARVTSVTASVDDLSFKTFT